MAACESCGHDPAAEAAAEVRALSRPELNMRLLELAGRMRPKGATVDQLLSDAMELQKFTNEPEGWDGS